MYTKIMEFYVIVEWKATLHNDVCYFKTQEEFSEVSKLFLYKFYTFTIFCVTLSILKMYAKLKDYFTLSYSSSSFLYYSSLRVVYQT